MIIVYLSARGQLIAKSDKRIQMKLYVEYLDMNMSLLRIIGSNQLIGRASYFVTFSREIFYKVY